MSIFKRNREATPPGIETPEGCYGHGAIVVEPHYVPNERNVIVSFACPGIDCGASAKEIYSNPRVRPNQVTDSYLWQVKKASEAAIGAMCFNCSMNPLNRIPDDLSELDRPPRND